jgi:hypothetical protein
MLSADVNTSDAKPLEWSQKHWQRVLPLDGEIVNYSCAREGISEQPRYKCLYSNLAIKSAFGWPDFIFTGRTESSTTQFRGRFRDVACMNSWLENNRAQLGSQLYQRLGVFLITKWCSSDLPEAPDPRLLRLNGGTMSESEWVKLYDSSLLQSLKAPLHAPTEREIKNQKIANVIRKQNNNSSAPFLSKMTDLDSNKDLDILNAQHAASADASASAQQLLVDLQLNSADSAPPVVSVTAAPSPHTPKASAHKKRSAPMDVDSSTPAKTQKPKSKKPKVDANPFTQFLNGTAPVASAAHLNGSAPASVVPAAPKKKAAPRQLSAVEQAQRALDKAKAEDLAKKKVQPAASVGVAAVSSSSGASNVSPAVPATVKLPGAKRKLIMHKGNKKVENDSANFYQDIVKIVLSDSAFGCGGVARVALLVVDDKGQVRVSPLVGSHHISVDLSA